MKPQRTIATVLAMLLLAGTQANADDWPRPSVEDYSSEDGSVGFTVTPAPLAAQATDATAFGILYSRDINVESNTIWFRWLDNKVAPVRVLLANGGRYVVTLDNWYRVGYGDNVVVIYGQDGDLVRKYGLSDLLTEKEIEETSHSISSIWWGREHRIDEQTGVLVLVIKNGDDTIRGEIRVELASGDILSRSWD